MPAYLGPGKAPLLMANQQAYLFNAETFASGTSSVAYLLDRVSQSNHPLEFAVGVSFSGAPGAFEIDVQASEVDNDASYTTVGTTITTVSAGNTARFAGVGYIPKFVRVKQVTAPANVVNMTVVLSR